MPHNSHQHSSHYSPQVPIWDDALIARYDLSGPRYTSYPTAPQFQENFPLSEVGAAIQRSNQSGRPLSLYFHIPFCNTVCYYCACNKIITANRKRAAPYLDLMIREMRSVAAKVDNSRPVDQLHWGGGTPTYISDDEKRHLMSAIADSFNLRTDDSGEYSIEIHPGDMDVETIGCLRDLGFNRLSMGVQDFDPVVQKAVNRFNSVADVRALVDEARNCAFHSISMDLIYGLPHQSWQTFSRTLESVIDLRPDRLSVFNYAHMPHLFKVQKQIDADALPTPAEKLDMMHRMTDRLLAAGYVYIGMDHFALPDDELAVAQRGGHLQRNFQGYSTHGGCDLFAFGVSSISAIDNLFYQNYKAITDYAEAVGSGLHPVSKGFVLSKDDLVRQAVIKQLICHFYLSFDMIDCQFGIQFDRYFQSELEQLQPMVDDGLVAFDASSLKVTDAGRLFIRRICMTFDAYLKGSPEIRYSRII
ncbi:MAG: oxygen-independent coproporphyrinogen III oxidase [bacterium]